MKRSKKRIFAFLCAAVLGGGILVNHVVFLRHTAFEDGLSYITYPIVLAAHTISTPVRLLVNIISTSPHNIERQRLKEALEQERGENIKLRATLKHVDDLSEIRSFQKRYHLDDILHAKILLKHLGRDEQYLLINKGTTHGVTKDMAALYKFQLLGRITDVFPYYSKVTLITDRNSKVAAYANESKAQGIVVGHNRADYCTLSYVNHLEEVHVGDFVISSGEGLVFPEGFALGTILEYSTDKFTHDVRIKPLVKLQDILYCSLIDKNAQLNV